MVIWVFTYLPNTCLIDSAEAAFKDPSMCANRDLEKDIHARTEIGSHWTDLAQIYHSPNLQTRVAH